MIKTTITEKLVTYFLLLNITAIGLVGLLSYIRSKEAVNQRAFEQLTSLKVIKKRQLENYFRDRVNEMGYFSGLIQLSGILNYIKPIKYSHANDSIIETTNPEVHNFLLQILNNFNYYNKVFLFSGENIFKVSCESNDIIKSTTDDFTFLKDIQKDVLKNNKSGIYEYVNNKRDSTSVIYLASPFVSKNSRASGVIVFGVKFDKINSIMYETNPNDGLGKSGESYIIGKDYLMRTNSRFVKSPLLKTIVKTIGAQNAVKNLEGTSIYKDYRNVEVLGSYGKLNIDGLNWFVLAEIDLEEANLPIVKMRNNILFLTLIIAAIVFIFTYLLSKRITIPIIRLTEATQKIATGSYEQMVPESNDEIGILTSNFNNLSNTLHEQELVIEKERQKRSESSIEAMEKERQRLSRELHDSLGQTLISQKLMLESIDISNTAQSQTLLTGVKKSIDVTINEVRAICNDLMPAVLFEFGLVNAIRKLCNDLNEFCSMDIIFNSSIKTIRIEDKTKVYLFRITQEGLKNAIQHSGGTKCIVELNSTNKFIFLNISDDGKGIDKSIIQEGNGLINIKERVNILGGTFSIKAEKNKGSKLIIQIPNIEKTI